MKQRITTYEQAVEYLLRVPKFTTKNSIEATREYLHRLGDPDRKMRIIHVAGTNGKGSVCAYLRSILEEAGYTTAVFTSPNLVDIRERFVIQGEMITRDAFLQAFLRIYEDLEDPAEGKYHPSFFEFLFFMAMLLFAEAKPDYCILETGLGGRLDSTNAISRKEAAVITRISRDHVEYLGDTIAEIAGEKAGIMKEGAPVIFTASEPEACAVIEKKAAELGISAYPVSKNDYTFLKIHNKSIAFSLHTQYYDYIRLILHTIAAYQMENAALAVRTAEVLDGGKTITLQHITRGLERCFWAGRMEEVLPEVFVDGAHNEDGIRAFLETVRLDGCERRSLLFSVVADKDYVHMGKLLMRSGLFDRIAIAHMHTGRAADLDSLKALFEEAADCDCIFYDNVETAFRKLLKNREKAERIYIAGSLYLVGEIKELLKHD